MSRFVLQACHVRGSRVVPSDAPPLTLNARELVERFASSKNRGDLMKLRAVRLGGYLGFVRSRTTAEVKVLFSIWRPDRANEIDFLLKSCPDFSERLLEVYRMLEVDWGSRVEEPLSGKTDPIPKGLPLRRRALQEATA